MQIQVNSAQPVLQSNFIGLTLQFTLQQHYNAVREGGKPQTRVQVGGVP